jgi:hypothetical protein
MKGSEYFKMQEEYRVILRLWSDTRALYPENSLEVIEIEEKLSEVEYLLGHTEPARFKEPPVREVEK